MRFYSKDKDPRLDNRDARANGRKIKTDLMNLNIVSSYYGVDIQRADNRVTWDYDKDKWCANSDAYPHNPSQYTNCIAYAHCYVFHIHFFHFQLCFFLVHLLSKLSLVR